MKYDEKIIQRFCKYHGIYFKIRKEVCGCPMCEEACQECEFVLSDKCRTCKRELGE